jgi:hypothetical protein
VSEVIRVDTHSGMQMPPMRLPQLRVVNPNGAHRVELREGWVWVADPIFVVELAVDEVGKNLFTLTADELMEHYERCHHIVHGHDARGLDPREGPTRLTVR